MTSIAGHTTCCFHLISHQTILLRKLEGEWWPFIISLVHDPLKKVFFLFLLLSILFARLLMAVLLKHCDLSYVVLSLVEHGQGEHGVKQTLPKSIAELCRVVCQTKRSLIKVNYFLNIFFFLLQKSLLLFLLHTPYHSYKACIRKFK